MKGFRIYYYCLNVAHTQSACVSFLDWYHKKLIYSWTWTCICFFCNCWIRIIEGSSKKEYKLDPALEFASQRVLRWNAWLTVFSVMLSLWYRVIEFYPRRAGLQCQLVYASEVDRHLNRRIGELLKFFSSKVSFCRSQWHARNICCIVFYLQILCTGLGRSRCAICRDRYLSCGSTVRGLQPHRSAAGGLWCQSQGVQNGFLFAICDCMCFWMLQTFKVKVLTPDPENALFLPTESGCWKD